MSKFDDLLVEYSKSKKTHPHPGETYKKGLLNDCNKCYITFTVYGSRGKE